MRNVFAFCALVFILLWFFIDNIFILPGEKTTIEESDAHSQLITGKEVSRLNVKKMASLLGVEYEEEVIAKDVEAHAEIDVTLEVVLIYTSVDNHKVRVNRLVNGDYEEVDMQVGDQLYNYRLSVINPSSIIFDNGENRITLKVFESIIISVKDLPKEDLD